MWKILESSKLKVMDISAPIRPLSNSRPTQAYYVPRRLLEGGRGPYSVSGDSKSVEGFVNQPDGPQFAPKPRSSNEVRTPPKKTIVTTHIEPRPLMADLLPRTDSHHEKRRTPRIAEQLVPPSFPQCRTTQLKPFTPRIVNAPRGPMTRPNTFCTLPFPLKGICICDRPKVHVVCKRCGYECVGRVQLVCDVHPTSLSLMDMRECANPICRSIQIYEAYPLMDNNISGILPY
ncbi:hypothetical protein KIN20_036109 [Parelaphostrongylus tenuis]|uniref:Uncharacterized protein n=1 Tax=Parelaphostrongylus tenuis TaxID=148309 RepID=A0AAD5RCD8_PARTN|nr:hypothetical protein KIN20_036109 [Parelaphostrongylus tenuis]